MLRNFKPSLVLGKDVMAEVYNDQAFTCVVSMIAKAIDDAPSMDTAQEVLHSIFTSHFRIDDTVVEPNITLGELLNLVDNFAEQESVSPIGIKKILLDKQTGLVHTSKLMMPIMLHRYTNGSVESNSRHRTLAMSVLAFAVAKQLKSGHGWESADAIECLEKSPLWVLKLGYNVEDSLNVLAEKAGKAVVPSYWEPLELARLLDSQAILVANGSRTPQDGEKESVLLSSQGIKPRNIPSVINAYKKGLIKTDAMLRFVASNQLFEAGGGSYKLRLHPAMKMAEYSQFFSSTPKKAITAYMKSLWGYSYPDKVYSARWLLSGCVNAQPSQNAKGEMRTPAPRVSSADATLIQDALQAAFQSHTLPQWKDLLGSSFDFFGLQNGNTEVELNLLELAAQLAHCQEGSSTIIDRLFRSGKSADKCAPAFMDLMIATLDKNLREGDVSGVEVFLGFEGYDDEEEVEEEGTVSVGSDDYDFEDL